MGEGKEVLRECLDTPGVYILYRDDQPYYIGQALRLIKRLSTHALKPNARRYNFWNYFSAFEIQDQYRRDEIEAILISAMPTANSSRPKFQRRLLDRRAARLLNSVQALMLTGKEDASGETAPETAEDEDESVG